MAGRCYYPAMPVILRTSRKSLWIRFVEDILPWVVGLPVLAAMAAYYLFLVAIGVGLLYLIASPLWGLAKGNYEPLRDQTTRVLMCVSFLFWSWLYHESSKTPVKFLWGIVKVAGSLWGLWLQLKKLVPPSNLYISFLHYHGKTYTPPTKWETIVFVGAGLAVLASGIKDVDEGAQLWEKNDWG